MKVGRMLFQLCRLCLFLCASRIIVAYFDYPSFSTGLPSDVTSLSSVPSLNLQFRSRTSSSTP